MRLSRQVCVVQCVLSACFLLISCQTYGEDDTHSIVPWNMPYASASLETGDAYPLAGGLENEMDRRRHPLERLWGFAMGSFERDIPVIERTPSIQSEMRESFEASLAQWLTSDDVIGMADLLPIELAGGDGWTIETRDSTATYWYNLTIETEGAKLLSMGLPTDGLVEGFILVEYDDIDEFNELAHFFLNIPEYCKAEPDYRVVRLRYTSSSTGPVYAYPEDWDYGGYIIRFSDGNREGVIRSATRDYAFPDLRGNDTDLTSIEFTFSF